jgi:hypothetical protein
MGAAENENRCEEWMIIGYSICFLYLGSCNLSCYVNEITGLAIAEIILALAGIR